MPGAGVLAGVIMCRVKPAPFDPLGLGAGALIDGVSRPWRSHDEAPPLEHVAWLNWFEPGNGGRPPSAARRPRPNDTAARAPQNKMVRGHGAAG